MRGKVTAVLAFGALGAIGGSLLEQEHGMISNPDQFEQPVPPTLVTIPNANGPIVSEEARAYFAEQDEQYQTDLATYNQQVTNDANSADWKAFGAGAIAGEVLLLAGAGAVRTLRTEGGQRGFAAGFSHGALTRDLVNRRRRG